MNQEQHEEDLAANLVASALSEAVAENLETPEQENDQSPLIKIQVAEKPEEGQKKATVKVVELTSLPPEEKKRKTRIVRRLKNKQVEEVEIHKEIPEDELHTDTKKKKKGFFRKLLAFFGIRKKKKEETAKDEEAANEDEAEHEEENEYEEYEESYESEKMEEVVDPVQGPLFPDPEYFDEHPEDRPQKKSWLSIFSASNSSQKAQEESEQGETDEIVEDRVEDEQEEGEESFNAFQSALESGGNNEYEPEEPVQKIVPVDPIDDGSNGPVNNWRVNGKIIKEGYIYKQGFYFTNHMKRRYFVLNSDYFLAYFKGPKSAHEQTRSKLAHISNIKPTEFKSKKHPYGIEMKGRVSPIFLAFTDEKDRDDWIEALKGLKQSQRMHTSVGTIGMLPTKEEEVTEEVVQEEEVQGDEAHEEDHDEMEDVDNEGQEDQKEENEGDHMVGLAQETLENVKEEVKKGEEQLKSALKNSSSHEEKKKGIKFSESSEEIN